MEIDDDCSVNSETGTEEDDDEEFSPGSGTESSTESSNSSSTSQDSGDESEEAQNDTTTTSETQSSSDEDEEEKGVVYVSKQPQEKWETCAAASTKVKLPQDLCEHRYIFKELFTNSQIWQDHLTESQKEHLYSFLPNFPKDCDVNRELDKTIEMLFSGEIQRFGISPLDDFHIKLSAGHFRPDIKKIRNLVQKAQKRKYFFEERKRTYELACDLLKSRESLLSDAYKQGYYTHLQQNFSKINWKKLKSPLESTNIRYKREMKVIRTKMYGINPNQESGSLTEGEEEDELKKTVQKCVTPIKLSKRDKLFVAEKAQKKGVVEDNVIRPVYSTMERIESKINVNNLVELTDNFYKEMLIEHKKRRGKKDKHPELNTEGISFSDLMQRAQLGQKHKLTLSTTPRLLNPRKRLKIEHSNYCNNQQQEPNHQVKPQFNQHQPQIPQLQLQIQKQKLQQPIKPDPFTSSISPIKSSSVSFKLENDKNFLHINDDIKHSIFLDDVQKSSFISNVKNEPADAFELKSHNIASPTVKSGMLTNSLVNSTNNQAEDCISISDIDIKEEEFVDMSYDIKSNDNIIVNSEIPAEVQAEIEEAIEKKELDLDNIDMMQLPIQLDDGIDILGDVKCEDGNIISIPDKELEDSIVDDIVINGDELMQETYACFFSLIRSVFLSKGEYRMNETEVRDAVRQWQDNPISPLNDWYALTVSWPDSVSVALSFLAGELVYTQDPALDVDQDFVPYLENKGNGIYAWIGAGRDTDAHLVALCNKFLLFKDSLTPPKPAVSGAVVPSKQHHTTATFSELSDNCESSVIESLGVDGLASNSPDWEPPKALCPTEWKVRPSATEEKEEFRRQERLRYASPHKAFTYRMHGFLSIVGPVKGIYQHNAGSGITKARGHSLLVPDRPNFVTILALVRDAAARLPNGEGTRADICQLLKDSQYIQEEIFNSDKEGNLNSIVSGALDRLHYETDPCVRYYPKRKEWLYLHRGRSESEFELYHQQLQGLPKNKKNSGSNSRSKTHPGSKLNAFQKEASQFSRELPVKKEKKHFVPVPSKKDSKKIDESKINVANDQVASSEQIQVSTPLSAQSAALSPIAKNASVQKVHFIPKTNVTKKFASVQKGTGAVTQKSSSLQKSVNLSQKIVTVHKNSMSNTLPTNCTTASSVQTSSVGAQTLATFVNNTLSTAATQAVEKEVSNVIDSKQQILNSTATIKKIATNVNVKPIVVKTTASQSLLQSNQPHFPHQQIQVSTSAGLQTIRLTGHSVLQTSQSIANNNTTNAVNSNNTLHTPVTLTTSKIQSHLQPQQNILNSQIGKSILQTANVKHQPLQQQQQQFQQQQQQTQVLPAKTLLASQIKLVSSGQIKSLLTSHGLQGQTIFIKQSPSTSASQTQHMQQPTQQIQIQQQPQLQQRVVAVSQGQSIQNQAVQRIIAQIGGKPIAVQIQQTPQQQQQQQKVLAKVLTSTSPSPLMSVESILAQKGIKLATQGGYLVSQTPSTPAQQKIIVSSPQQQQVRMVTAGKPIVLASGTKSVGINLGTGGNLVIGKPASQQQSQQQPIILPSQLLNIKALQGLKVIPTAGGLKATSTALLARVFAPSSITTQSSSGQQQLQQSQQQVHSATLNVQNFPPSGNTAFGGMQ